MSVAQTPLDAGWRAHLRLGFQRRGARSVPAVRRHEGPLLVQRPFYPEGDLCHSYVIHPPGGVAGGDRLTLEVSCATGAQALITTPGAGKFYRSAEASAAQRQALSVDADASLEWFPQGQIVFDGARVDSLTRVDLAPGARFCGWDITCLGRPASGERWRQGHWRSRFEVYRAGRPLLIERGLYRSDDPALDAAWGLAGFPVQALMVLSDAAPGQLDAGRSLLVDADERVALTQLGELVVARYLGHSAARAQTLFTQLWQVWRPVWLGRPACLPRIWAT